MSRSSGTGSLRIAPGYVRIKPTGYLKNTIEDGRAEVQDASRLQEPTRLETLHASSQSPTCFAWFGSSHLLGGHSANCCVTRAGETIKRPKGEGDLQNFVFAGPLRGSRNKLPEFPRMWESAEELS